MKSGRLEKVRPDYDAEYLAELIGQLESFFATIHSAKPTRLLHELRRCSVEYRLTEIRERKLAREVDTLRRIDRFLRGLRS